MCSYGCPLYTNAYFDPNYNPYLRAYINSVNYNMPSQYNIPFSYSNQHTQTEPACWSIWSFTDLDYHLLQARKGIQRRAPADDEADELLAACY